MKTCRLASSLALLGLIALGLPGVASTQVTTGSGYTRQVSPGIVTLEFEPEWQDTALVVVVQAEVRPGSGIDLRTVSLRDQVMLMCERMTHEPYAAGELSGRKAVAWVAFRLPQKPRSFALSVRDVPDVPMRIIRWPEAALTP